MLLLRQEKGPQNLHRKPKPKLNFKKNKTYILNNNMKLFLFIYEIFRNPYVHT